MNNKRKFQLKKMIANQSRRYLQKLSREYLCVRFSFFFVINHYLKKYIEYCTKTQFLRYIFIVYLLQRKKDQMLYFGILFSFFIFTSNEGKIRRTTSGTILFSTPRNREVPLILYDAENICSFSIALTPPWSALFSKFYDRKFLQGVSHS